MKYLIIPIFLFLFLFTATVLADDIATIRAFLDNPSDDAVVQHGVYMACLNLTRTGTAEAVPMLKQLLDDERFSTVARTALVNIPGGIERVTPAQPELPQDAALLALILRDGEPGLSTLTHALKDDKVSFNVILRAVLELESDKTGNIVLANMGDLPLWQQAALVRNLGARQDSVAIVPALIEMANGDKLELRLAAIEALGEIGDLRAVDAVLLAIEADNAELVDAARESLKFFEGEEFDRKIIALLDHSDKKLRLAALNVIRARQIATASEKLKELITDSDTDIRTATYRAFANSVAPTVENIKLLLEWLQQSRTLFGGLPPPRTGQPIVLGERDALREAILTLCRRTDDRENVAMLFSPAQRLDLTLFYLDCLFQLGGETAAKTITIIAMGDNDALTDRATQLLGQWTTPEVAPFLIHIAEHHPVERYRSRTLRGYLRVIRQMGLPVEQKVQMAEKALAVAETDTDKAQATEVLERFRAMVRGRPIFDGKTFDGWEFRNNEEWFRIEDGAIVAGSFERRIPHHAFLVSKEEFGDFTLWIECKAIGQGANGGVQFRSFRPPADSPRPFEMIGYQADMTDTARFWGAIYDESRRNRFIAEPPPGLIERIFRPNDWNEYKIVAKGNNVRLYLNDVLTVDYTETDESIPARGFIGLQIHGGSPYTETWYRNIRIEEHE